MSSMPLRDALALRASTGGVPPSPRALPSVGDDRVAGDSTADVVARSLLALGEAETELAAHASRRSGVGRAIAALAAMQGEVRGGGAPVSAVCHARELGLCCLCVSGCAYLCPCPLCLLRVCA